MGRVDQKVFPDRRVTDARLSFMEAGLARDDLTDDEWALVGALLPSERSRWSRPAQDNRFLNGMVYVLRVGCLAGNAGRTQPAR